MIKGLHHIAVLCSDRDTALPFYETLGFEKKESHIRPERNDEIIILEGYGITIELFIDAAHLSHVTNPEAYGVRHIALLVTDIEKVIEYLLKAGYSPEPIRRDSFTGAKMTFIKDPDGLPIELHE